MLLLAISMPQYMISASISSFLCLNNVRSVFASSLATIDLELSNANGLSPLLFHYSSTEECMVRLVSKMRHDCIVRNVSVGGHSQSKKLPAPPCAPISHKDSYDRPYTPSGMVATAISITYSMVLCLLNILLK